MNNWRAYLVIIAFIIAGCTLSSRLFFLQVVNHGFYKALAQGQRISTSVTEGERGNIFLKDMDGRLILLATNKLTPYVFISPAEVEDEKQIAEELEQILGITQSQILEMISHKESLYAVIKKKISQEEEAAIKEKNLKGVYLEYETIRFYPEKSFASHVLGFVNQDGKGQYGVEGHYDKALTGQEGLGGSSQNPAVHLLSSLITRIRNGENIILTLDYNIQSMAEALLQRAKSNLSVKEGNIIVMDPKSGKILALAGTPSFDPNEYAKISDFNIFQNGSIEKIFEPGSVFKPLTMAASLNEGAVTPETTYEDKGILRIGGYKILNYDNRVWGQRSMKEVLQFSINTGAVFAKDQLGNRKFLEYIQRFGFFESTNVGLAGEVYSQNRGLKQGYDINFATASFGQGIEMTPLQLVQAYTALANNGKEVTPHIIQDKKSAESIPVISPETALQITSMLVGVTEEGYGKSARVPGYYVAGKTGTAQIPWSALGINQAGYSDQTIQSFIGYAPAYNPRFLILVKLNNPAAKTAEYSAVPIFQQLAKYLIDYLEIPPDYE